jgi:hypothetical protein
MLKIETFSDASSLVDLRMKMIFFLVQTVEYILVFAVDGFVIIHLLIFQTLSFLVRVITKAPYLVLVSKLPVFHIW